MTAFPSFCFEWLVAAVSRCHNMQRINCCARRHEVDQENAFSVPENGCHDFFTEIEVLNFLVLGNAYGVIAVTTDWIQKCGERPMFHPQSQWSPEINFLPVRSV